MLLLTGATGLVGSECLPRLLRARPDRPIVTISRRRDRLAAWAARDVQVLQGSLAEPGFGLSGELQAELASEITEIVHCAADTRFGLSLEEARAANVETTRNLLEFARECRQLRKVAHVSTVYVAGQREGPIAESAVAPGPFSNTYQQSKWEAEALAFAAMAEMPLAIFRLSTLMGDSETGCVRQFNHMHRLLRMLPWNTLKKIPADAGALVDLVATDWAAESVTYVYERAFTAGQVYHVCRGSSGSVRFGELLEKTVELFGRHESMKALAPFCIPEFVSRAEFGEYAAEQRDRLMQETLRVLSLFIPHLALRQEFCHEKFREAMAGSGIVEQPARETFARVVEYCLETDWGRKKR